MTPLPYPNDPGYTEARARLLAKAQAADPRWRWVEPWERDRLDAADMASWCDTEGRQCSPSMTLLPGEAQDTEER